MRRVAVLFSGTGSNFAYLAEHLPGKGIEIAVALTNNPQAGGMAVAHRQGIPLEIIPSADYTDREAFDAEVVTRLESYAPDLTVLAGFMRILTPVFTERICAINLHPSLLPRHKGLDAIRKSYDDPYPEGGVTLHWVTSELDGGAVILQRRVAKEGLDLEAYDHKIRVIEKEALGEAVLKILNGK